MSEVKDNNQNADGQNRKHDAGYKKTLLIKENVERFIKQFVHEPWAANISPDDLELVNKSFVTDGYNLLDSDIIYKLKIADSDVYFYFLIELQSQVDFTMPFRLLKYMTALLNEIFQNTPEDVRTRKGFKLPAIVPIILYNGDDNWTPARRFSECTQNAEIFGDCVIDFRYLLFDLKRADDSVLSSPEHLLDAIFSFDKERLMSKDDISPEMLTEWWEKKTNKLSEDDKYTLFGWVSQVLYKGIATDEINEIIENSIKKGSKNMKHLFEVVADRMEDRFTRNGERQKSLKIAKKLRDKGMSVDEVAEATDLTVDEVLQL